LATLEKARAAVSQAQATLELSLIDVANTVIRAPVDGVVGQRTIRVGQYVDPGQPLLAVVPVQAVYVVANLKETQLDRV
ncbi:HlyD family efflux transporter periplasmic adaptor subunit, partial [Shewanella algae]